MIHIFYTLKMIHFTKLQTQGSFFGINHVIISMKQIKPNWNSLIKIWTLKGQKTNYQDHTFFLFLFPPKKRRNPKRGFIGGFRKSGDLLLAVDDTMRVCYTQIKPHFQNSRNSRRLLLARREKVLEREKRAALSREILYSSWWKKKKKGWRHLSVNLSVIPRQKRALL